MKKTNLYLTERQLEFFRAQHKKTGITVAEQIRRALDEYLERKEEKNRYG